MTEVADIIKNDNYTLVKIKTKNLDMDNSYLLKSKFVVLDSNNENTIIVDMNESTFVDSSGLSALLLGRRLCLQKNKELGLFILCRLQPSVLNLIQLCGLDAVFPIADSIEEAEIILKEAIENGKTF